MHFYSCKDASKPRLESTASAGSAEEVGDTMHVAYMQRELRYPTRYADQEATREELAADEHVVVVQLDEKKLRHTNDVVQLAFSSDGKRLATGSRSGVALVWERAADGWDQTRLPSIRHQSTLSGCTWADGGQTLLTASTDGQLRSWPLDEYRDDHIQWSLEGAPDVTTVAASPSGSMVASGGSDGHVYLYDARFADRAEADLFVGHRGDDVFAAWSVGDDPRDVLSLATASRASQRGGESLELVDWRTDSRSILPAIDDLQKVVRCSGGRFLVAHTLLTGNLQKDVRVINAQTGEEVASGRGAQSLVALPSADRFAVGTKGLWLRVASPERTVTDDAGRRQLDWKTKQLAQGARDEKIVWLASTREQNSDVVYAGTDGKEPSLFRVVVDDSGEIGTVDELPGLNGAGSGKESLSLSGLTAGGQWVAVIRGPKQSVSVLDTAADGAAWGHDVAGVSQVSSVAVSPQGHLVAVANDELLWGEAQSATLDAADLRDSTIIYRKVGLMPNGRFYALGRRGRRAVVLTWSPGSDPSTGVYLRSRPPVVLAAVQPSGEGAITVASLGAGGAYHEWVPKNPSAPAFGRSLVPAGYTVVDADASVDATKICLTATNGKQTLARFLQRSGVDEPPTVNDLKMPPGKQLSSLATCAVEGDHIVVWDAGQNAAFSWRIDAPEAAREIAIVPPAVASVASVPEPVAVSSEGLVGLTSPARDGKFLYAFDVTEPGPIQLEGAPAAHPTGDAPALVFSNRGKRLLVGAASGQVIVYNVANTAKDATSGMFPAPEKMTAFSEHRRPVASLYMTSDGVLLSGAREGEVLLWPLPPSKDTAPGAADDLAAAH